MGKMLYSATMSLDGFISGPGGDMSWLTGYLGPNPTMDEIVDQIGALLVGGRTFRGDDPHKGDVDKEGKPFGGGWTGAAVRAHPSKSREILCRGSSSSMTSRAV